jgi:hypothetical protein
VEELSTPAAANLEVAFNVSSAVRARETARQPANLMVFGERRR